MPPPEIPIELQEHVLDHLHDDQETLKSCNLVCRAWTWKSRRYFWRVVNPEKRRHCIRLLSILEETAQLGACVGDFVEEFRLPKMGFPRRHSQSDLRCELLRSTARYFPMLKFLNVKEFSITSFLNHLRSEDEAFNMQEAVSSILDFRHLKAIQYDSVTVSDLDDLLQFHGAFPTVSALYMHRVDTKNNENWMGDPLNTTSIQDFVARHRDGRICIEDLTGCICDIPVGRLSQFLNTLTAPPFELRIKRLSWAMAPHRWGSFLPILLHMFRRAESTLEHFELPFSADDSYVTMFWPSRHHRLKTLAFSFYFPTYVTPVWAYVSMWLQWVNPTSLEAIEFCLYHRHDPFLHEFFPWPTLNSALISLHQKRPSLSVKFSFWYHGEEDKIPDAVAPTRRRIRPMVAAGIPVFVRQHRVHREESSG